MSEYTKGPWAIEEVPYLDRGDAVICDVDGESLEVELPFYSDTEKANARLIAAAPELLEALTMGATVNTPEFLEWLADRLVHIYKENPNVDFVLSLRQRANAARAAIAKATGSETKNWGATPPTMDDPQVLAYRSLFAKLSAGESEEILQALIQAEQDLTELGESFGSTSALLSAKRIRGVIAKATGEAV